MDQYRRLRDNLMQMIGAGKEITIWQGIVKSVEGTTCTVTFGTLDVEGVRLRASLAENESHLLIVPKVNTAVVVGSLSNDLSLLVVLAVDEVESITINGGKLGGLINIESLTQKINELVRTFNNHTHQVSTTGSATAQTGTAAAVASKASELNKSDYEDTKVTH
ncbi:MAG: hypothetical protein EGP72_06275 [Phocaeicola plebeius]|jgi:hypothetical protein|uniref:hypothetical protein n=1 Tax=Phocaeicola plebeius TaxID=310297 RepID=UPI001DAA2D8F|nr:hypothetical protein [Phocaeicola plebeius]DAV88535.1 MAG TPA: hypothetical protein [Caudoviricetes sp.]